MILARRQSETNANLINQKAPDNGHAFYFLFSLSLFLFRLLRSRDLHLAPDLYSCTLLRPCCCFSSVLLRVWRHVSSKNARGLEADAAKVRYIRQMVKKLVVWFICRGDTFHCCCVAYRVWGIVSGFPRTIRDSLLRRVTNSRKSLRSLAFWPNEYLHSNETECDCFEVRNAGIVHTDFVKSKLTIVNVNTETLITYWNSSGRSSPSEFLKYFVSLLREILHDVIPEFRNIVAKQISFSRIKIRVQIDLTQLRFISRKTRVAASYMHRGTRNWSTTWTRVSRNCQEEENCWFSKRITSTFSLNVRYNLKAS